ncbi:MAG: apolipoprotein N-acyltransferase [Actinomycetia bacterium]|nr:apolipoprotein N-acyltransferase [Actinomycetes bacterium]
MSTIAKGQPTARKVEPLPARPVPLLATVLASAAIGGFLVLAFPPYDLWWLAPVAVTGMLAALDLGTRTGRPMLRGALLGAVFGLVFFGLLTPWLRVIGPDAWLLVVVLSAAFTALFGAGATLLVRLRGWPFWVACWWVGVEALRGRVPFGGFPWGRLGHSQADAPTAAWASVGGVPLLGFILVLAGALLLVAVKAAVRRHLLRSAIAAGAALAIVLSGLAIPLATAGRQITVAIVQGNVPRTGMDAFGQREAVLAAHLDATHQLADDVRAGAVAAPDVVIWPENASDIDPALDADAFAAIDDVVKDVGVPVLVGMVVEVDGGDRVANQGTVWDPVTGPGASYIKQNLVPFGEYVPFRSTVEKFITRLDRIPRDFVAGDKPGVIDLGPVTVADVICFDVSFDSAVRDAVAGGGELITVQTNNATYGRTGQVEQQWAMSRLRAVEHGRTVLVASTSGISGIIAPDGEVQAETPEFVQQVVVESVVARTDQTLATRVGAWPELVLSLLGLGAVVLAAVRRRGRIAA